MGSEKYTKIGDIGFSKMEKVHGELLSLMYGSLVSSLIKDYKDDADQVNSQLGKMGFNIGLRMADEFFAKSGVPYCQEFRETADVIAKVGFKMFLGINADVVRWNQNMTVCNIVLQENPFNEFVELPPKFKDTLWYSNLVCGVIRGALDQLQLRVDVRFIKDVLRGDDHSVIRLELLEILADNYNVE